LGCCHAADNLLQDPAAANLASAWDAAAEHCEVHGTNGKAKQ
jgi:hypothetical protein